MGPFPTNTVLYKSLINTTLRFVLLSARALLGAYWEYDIKSVYALPRANQLSAD